MTTQKDTSAQPSMKEASVLELAELLTIRKYLKRTFKVTYDENGMIQGGTMKADDIQKDSDVGRHPLEILNELQEVFKLRNQQYGDSYLTAGQIMEILFPDGIQVKGAREYNRLMIYIHIITKFTRYAHSLQTTGHMDSAEDMCVYSAMLASLTDTE